MRFKNFKIVILFVCLVQVSFAQRGGIKWTANGNAYTKIKEGGIVKVDPNTDAEVVIVRKEQLTLPGATAAMVPQSYTFNGNNTKLLFFTNTAKVWRYNTRGDYWVLDIISNKLKQMGKSLPAQSLMFAKFSPDSRKCAYVSEHNLYVEDIGTGAITKLTRDGSRKLINGTFDWVYEEEFGCRDGFRWSPDGSKIAFWQVDANKIRDYYMLNTTDSIYSQVIPVEYPKVGEAPSPVRIGVITLETGNIRWMDIEGDPQQNYLPRMEWAGLNELVVQQLDRKQLESKLKYCNATDGSSRTFWAENSEAWIDLNADDPAGWNWINNGQEFIWVSEKDGWRHIYKISRDGKTETLLTKGNYDIGVIKCIDEASNHIYFTASPTNATQQYLYRVNIQKVNILQKVKKIVSKPKPDPELVSSANLKGTHDYTISPNGKYATHSFSNHNTPTVREWITLPDNKPINPAKSIDSTIKTDNSINIEYVQLVTDDNITLDAWINKPKNFDPAKKYPVVFYVYGEPAASTVLDRYGEQNNFLYNGDMRADGYVQVAVDNRGTPMLKGAAWRKSIYRKVGNINVIDMAKGFKKLMETNAYFDKDRIAIAAVANQLFYDNIYQERYMGLPQENREDFINGSPVTYAKNLKGNLLYIHGTGDDNVHFSNAEVLVNELIKYNKQFQYMPYPNRTHGISEGPGTSLHLSTLYTNYLREHCPPGAR
jgi:dipeptidyl-peptidase-4